MGYLRLTGEHLTIFLGVLCLLLSVLLFQSRKALALLQHQEKKQSTVQKTFSKAVAGIESSLEKERQNSARFLRILESINDGVAILDREGCLKYANSALWKLYAVPLNRKSDFMDRSWLELYSFKGQEEIKNKVFPVLETRNVWVGESDVQKQDGSIMRAELYISKTDDGYIGFTRDVTARYQAEQDREMLALQVHDLQKLDAVERAVRSIIHEFNNGLASAGGFAEMLMEDLPKDTESFEYAERIFNSSQLMQVSLEQARFLLNVVSARSH